MPNRESYCEILTQLNEVSAENFQFYCEKLQNNWQNPEVMHDLLFEARSALMFFNHGFQVQFNESPDLLLRLMGVKLYAEVKHFRLKEQDRLDQKALASYGLTLIPFGNTIPTEGVLPWEQVFNVTKRKLRNFSIHAPNLLVLASDSPHCIDDSIIPTAINMIDEAASTADGKAFRKLNGIILMASEFSISQKRRVYFFPTQHSLFNLPEEIVSVLEGIRNG